MHSTRSGRDSTKARKPEAGRPLLVSMIIDKSGSMSDLVADTVGGFNEYLADRQRESPQTLMSVTLFDTELDSVYVATPVSDVSRLTAERYRQGGMGNTALNDAIGSTIATIDKHGYARERNILIVVMTDGQENSSKEWTSRAKLAALVKSKEDAGWKFVFFGANIDAFAEAQSMNIPASRSIQFLATPHGTAASYRRVSRATKLFSEGASEATWVSCLSDSDTDP
jgi:Mg-chelatase subunit ChlD